MKLNCKPGDLAIVVRSAAGNEGKIVQCLKVHPSGVGGLFRFYGPVWEIDRPLKTLRKTPVGTVEGERFFAPDICLHPIRDNDGEDEMLRIAGRPIAEVTE